MVGRAGRDGAPRDTLLLASRSDASELRRFARSDIPTVADLRSVYARLRGRREVRARRSSSWRSQDEPDPRVLVGMLEQAGLVRRGFDAGRAMRDRAARAARRLGASGSTTCSRATSGRRWRASTGSSATPSRSRCRHGRSPSTSARRWTEDCGTCDVCSPLAAPADVVAFRRTPLPDDIAAADPRRRARAALAARRTGLVAMLCGSVSAPPSARRSPTFGLLSAASQADVKRWIQLLELSGALERFESDDGFRLLRAVPGAELPRIGARGRSRPGRRGALRAAARVAARAGARGRGAGVRRAPRRDAARARVREAGQRARSGRRHGHRTDQARALRGRRPRRDRGSLIPDRGYIGPLRLFKNTTARPRRRIRKLRLFALLTVLLSSGRRRSASG